MTLPLDPNHQDYDYCIFCKGWFNQPIAETHDRELCQGLMPDLDMPDNQPWPPPGYEPVPEFYGELPALDDDTTYWVIHPVLLGLITTAAFFIGTWLGVVIGVNIV